MDAHARPEHTRLPRPRRHSLGAEAHHKSEEAAGQDDEQPPGGTQLPPAQEDAHRDPRGRRQETQRNKPRASRTNTLSDTRE